jgi:hypothetical protein
VDRRIQLLESFRIDKPTVQDDRIFDGIQLDAKGRVLGYWLDGQSLLAASVLVHLFDGERFTNYRGISPIRRGANDMRDGNDIKGFQKVLSKLSTALTLAIQGEPLEENPWGSAPEPAGEGSSAEELPANPTTLVICRNGLFGEIRDAPHLAVTSTRNRAA